MDRNKELKTTRNTFRKKLEFQMKKEEELEKRQTWLKSYYQDPKESRN